MKIQTLLAPMAILLSMASYQANSASVSAGSNTSNSAGWQSSYDHYLKAQQADMIKKADEGFYGGYNYDSTYNTMAYSYSSTIEYNFELNGYDDEVNDDDDEVNNDEGEDSAGCHESYHGCQYGGINEL